VIENRNDSLLHHRREDGHTVLDHRVSPPGNEPRGGTLCAGPTFSWKPVTVATEGPLVTGLELAAHGRQVGGFC
jgi:hypothetical protein